jgi:hypothetical protein
MAHAARLTNQLIPQSGALLEKLVVAHLAKTSPPFMKPEGPLLTSQESVINTAHSQDYFFLNFVKYFLYQDIF